MIVPKQLTTNIAIFTPTTVGKTVLLKGFIRFVITLLLDFNKVVYPTKVVKADLKTSLNPM